MSGFSSPCCRICFAPIKVYRDYIESTLMEESYSCTNCKLCTYQWITGSGEYTVGFWDWQGHYTDDFSVEEWRRIRDEQLAVELETRALVNNPEFEQWKWLITKGVEEHRVDYLVFADKLGDWGYRLNEQGLRAKLL